MISILFVCTGNICRSPTAEGIFRKAAQQASLKAVVDSAGLHNYHVGDLPDKRTIACAYRHGVDLTDQRARSVTLDDFKNFDLMIAMDRGHRGALQAMMPKKLPKSPHIVLLGQYITEEKIEDIPDPYYGNHQGFDYVYALIEQGVQGLVHKLSKEGEDVLLT